MPDRPSSPNSGDAPADKPASERRQNLALRELIDEMLVSIRSATQGSLWTPEERTQYERELAMIMTRVRTSAVGSPADERPEAGSASGQRKN